MTVPIRTYIPAAATAVLLSLAYPNAGFSPIAWAALAPLFVSATALSPRHAAMRFFFAGWLFNSLVLSWLVGNVYWAGGWAIVGYQLLCVYFGLGWAACGALWKFVGDRLGLPNSAVIIAILWAAMEKLQETAFTGFGWTALAYSQGSDLPILQWASLGSVPLVGVFLVLVNANLALTYARPTERAGRMGLAVAIVLGAHAVGLTLIDPPSFQQRPLNIGLFQSSYPVEMKWDREYSVNMLESAVARSAALAAKEPVDVMVWPEALVVDNIEGAEYAVPIHEFVTSNDAYLLTGAARRDPENGAPFNAAYFYEPDGELQGYYDKIHLTPFGEYVPFGEYLPFVEQVVPAIGALSAGDEPKVFLTRDRRLAPLICFEVLFPAMASELRQQGADCLVAITNLSWFGASAGIPQELEVARLRAIETRLPLVHCSNSGISGIFDPWGRFTGINYWCAPDGNLYELRENVTPHDAVRARLVGSLPLPEAAGGPLVNHSADVPWAFVVISLALFLGAAIPRSRGKRRSIS